MKATRKNLRELIEWASDYEKVEAIIDNLIAKIDSNEISIADLPPIPASIKIIQPQATREQQEQK